MEGMNIVVCVKQIPDPATPGALDGSTNALKWHCNSQPQMVVAM
jgi:hypothetical protein